MTPQNQPQSVSLSCLLSALTPAERKRYESLKAHLREAKQETKELSDGFAFRFESS